MSLSGIRNKIDKALDTIDGLNHVSRVPSVVIPPMAFPALRPTDSMEYDLTARNARAVYHFYIEVLVNKGATLEQAQDNLDQYVMPWGNSSIKVAIENIEWGNTAETCRVTSVSNYGPAVYGGTEYLGARLGLSVWVAS